jgi:hypothetical protein
MTDTTFELQEQAFKVRSQEIEDLSKSIISTLVSLKVKAMMIWYFLKLYFILKNVRQLEQTSCRECDNCTSNITDNLKSLINSMNAIFNHLIKHKFSSIYLKINEYFIEEFENKLENHAIASDCEIKDLFNELHVKLN